MIFQNSTINDGKAEHSVAAEGTISADELEKELGVL